MRGAIPPLPQYASMAWCSVKAQGQLYFTLQLHSVYKMKEMGKYSKTCMHGYLICFFNSACESTTLQYTDCKTTF
jgi:hypothetical protein